MDDTQPEINFCSRCGAKIDDKFHRSDNVASHICKNCDAVYYDNPKIIVLSLVEFQGESITL